jgi:hypothetical protein
MNFAWKVTTHSNQSTAEVNKTQEDWPVVSGVEVVYNAKVGIAVKRRTSEQLRHWRKCYISTWTCSEALFTVSIARSLSSSSCRSPRCPVRSAWQIVLSSPQGEHHSSLHIGLVAWSLSFAYCPQIKRVGINGRLLSFRSITIENKAIAWYCSHCKWCNRCSKVHL